MHNDKEYIKQQIIQNLENYGVQWDEVESKISVNDFREVQRAKKVVFHFTNPLVSSKLIEWLQDKEVEPRIGL